MFINETAAWIIAKARQEQYLEAAELHRLLQASGAGQQSLWPQLGWWFGGLMIDAGERLQGGISDRRLRSSS